MISVFPKPIQKFPTHMKCLLSLLQCTFYVLNIMRTVFLQNMLQLLQQSYDCFASNDKQVCV